MLNTEYKTALIGLFNNLGELETIDVYFYFRICIKRDPLNDCQIRMDRNPDLDPFSVSIGMNIFHIKKIYYQASINACKFSIIMYHDCQIYNFILIHDTFSKINEFIIILL